MVTLNRSISTMNLVVEDYVLTKETSQEPENHETWEVLD